MCCTKVCDVLMGPLCDWRWPGLSLISSMGVMQWVVLV